MENEEEIRLSITRRFAAQGFTWPEVVYFLGPDGTEDKIFERTHIDAFVDDGGGNGNGNGNQGQGQGRA